MKKKALTYQDHCVLANQIHMMYYQTLNLATDVQFVGKNHKLVASLLKTAKNLIYLKSVLDNMLFRDHPNEADTKLYYPAVEPRTNRFQQPVNWDEIGNLVQKLLSNTVVLHNLYFGQLAVKSLPCQITDKVLRALEKARGSVGSIILFASSR